MASCSPVKFKHRGICTGDLDRIIKLRKRSLNAPPTGVDFTHTFYDSIDTWAAVVSVKGKDVFGGTNMDIAISHIFYVRYREGITAEWWVNFHSGNFDIVDVENFDERSEFIVLRCSERGSDAQPVNEA